MGRALPSVSLEKRVAFLHRADAVRRLQQIGRNREAGLLRSGLVNEISRLRGELRYANPHVTALMRRDVDVLLEKLRNAPQYEHHGHPGAVGIGLPVLKKKR